MSEPKDYSVQATPLILRDLGWETLKDLAETVYPYFNEDDFKPLKYKDGLPSLENVQIFYGTLDDTDSKVKSKKKLMVIPYLDTEGIRVLYCKWADEDYYDSFSVPDGQHKLWNNKEAKEVR